MSQSPVKLLLVEDDDIDRETVHRLLSTTDCRVYDAINGKEALDLLTTARPDCVLLDYLLPDTDGIALIAQLVQANMPVVVLTGVENPEIVVKAMRQGAQDYLVKSHLSSTSLFHSVQEAIRKVQMQRELLEKQVLLTEQTRVLAEKNRQISELASALTLVEQQERRRIALILHDDLQQLLYGIQLRTHLLLLDFQNHELREIGEHLTTLTRLTEEAISKTRNLAVELSPPVLNDAAVSALFDWLATHMKAVHNLDVQLRLENEFYLADEELRILLFQILRELLFNVVKHAKVGQARLRVQEQLQQTTICVEDDGAGFLVNAIRNGEQGKEGLGLYSARERLHLFGGELKIDSAPGAGTRVTLVLPKQWSRDGSANLAKNFEPYLLQ
jgi:signal transduction histidine kinase